jgi:hypothetical protein
MVASRRLTRAITLTLSILCFWTFPALGDTWLQGVWTDTVYYRATFRAAASGDAVLHVAAVDRYQIYLNGALVGADSVWSRMTSYEVALRRFSNELGVRVVNDGRGAGSGLVALVVGDSLRVATTANSGDVPWYWTDEHQDGAAWTKARITSSSAWQPVQAGTMDTRGVEGLADSTLAAVAGLPDGIDIGGAENGVSLGRIDGTNLALGQPSNRTVVTDGSLTTSWDPRTNALNQFASIDLQARFRISGVRVLTRGATASQLEANSLRGYSVQISDDQVTWSELAAIRDITQYAWSQVDFEPVSTRYVRVVIVDIDPTTSPRVAEVQVLGTGYREQGWLLSQVIEPAAAGVSINLGRIQWDATVPPNTGVAVQFRGGDGPADFAGQEQGWSDALTQSDSWYPAVEPARMFQYRVHLESRDSRVSPVFEELRLEYGAETAVSRARGSVLPNRVPMGVDTTFVYTLDLEFGPGDAGIDRVELAMPGQARLDPGAPIAALLDGWQSTGNLLSLVFSEPLRGVDELVVPVRTRTYAGLHEFRAYLFSPGSDNPLNVAESQDQDPVSGLRRSWTVSAATVSRLTLSAVRALPPVFTPNGDDINDYTVIEFALAKIDVPRPTEIHIHDLSGRRVRSLAPGALPAGEYARLRRSGMGDAAPGYWDGTDDQGQLVAPGTYLYRVKVELDTGDETLSGVVSVAY